MQQNDFRSLLGASKPPMPSTSAAIYKPMAERKQEALGKGEKPAFKPRGPSKKGKAKEAEPEGKDAASQWRDRAQERREGRLDDDSGAVPRPSKGLDFALLEQQREQQIAQEEAAVEDNLEAVFQGTYEELAPKKKTREELLADLAAQQAVARNHEGANLAKAKAEGKFKRIGDTGKAKEGSVTIRDAKTGQVKKLRKKKKAVAMEKEAVPPRDDITTSTIASAGPHPAEADLPIIAPAEPDDEDAESDIFAGVGDYDPFISDDDENKTPAEAAAGRAPVKLFDDDEEIKAEPLAAPAKRPAAPSDAAETTLRVRKRASDDDGDDSQPTRLEGFADSADVRSLLDIDNAAARDEKKKERKERRRALAAGEAPPEKRRKELSDKDKLNRDLQEYQNWAAKKQH